MTLSEFNIPEALTLLKPLGIYIMGMVLYAIFIFRFYRFLGRKDIFALDLSKYEHTNSHFLSVLLHVLFYFAKYLILFPVLTFFWFAVLTTLLSFLAKNQTVDEILLVSMAVLGTIRVAAYYHEDLSKDLAKILPFALLGVFVVDLRYFSVNTSLEALQLTLDRVDVVAYYLVFIIALEFLLRLTYPIVRLFTPVNLEETPSNRQPSPQAEPQVVPQMEGRPQSAPQLSADTSAD